MIAACSGRLFVGKRHSGGSPRAIKTPQKALSAIRNAKLAKITSTFAVLVALVLLLVFDYAARPTAAHTWAPNLLPPSSLSADSIANPAPSAYSLQTHSPHSTKLEDGPTQIPIPVESEPPATTTVPAGQQNASPDTDYRVFLPVIQFGVSATQTHRVYIPFFAQHQAPTPTPAPASPREPLAPTATPTPVPDDPSAIAVAIAEEVDRRPLRALDRQSKIGIGVYADGGGYVLNELLRARPGVVLLMDPKPEFAREVRRMLPKAFIFGRRFVEYQPLDNPEARGGAFADYVAELAVPLRGIVDGWMSYNEPVGRGDTAGYQAYSAFQVAFAKRLQGTYGIGAIAGNDPPGAVDIHDYPKYFGEAIRISKYFGIHSYSSPESSSLKEPDASWYVLRYRRIHSALLEAGIKSGPIILTEVGLAKGWREMRVNSELTTADFVWLADETAKDDYLLGFAIFGIFPERSWEPFDLGGTPILDRLARYDPADPVRLPTPTKQPTERRR